MRDSKGNHVLTHIGTLGGAIKWANGDEEGEKASRVTCAKSFKDSWNCKIDAALTIHAGTTKRLTK